MEGNHDFHAGPDFHSSEGEGQKPEASGRGNGINRGGFGHCSELVRSKVTYSHPMRKKGNKTGWRIRRRWRIHSRYGLLAQSASAVFRNSRGMIFVGIGRGLINGQGPRPWWGSCRWIEAVFRFPKPHQGDFWSHWRSIQKIRSERGAFFLSLLRPRSSGLRGIIRSRAPGGKLTRSEPACPDFAATENEGAQLRLRPFARQLTEALDGL